MLYLSIQIFQIPIPIIMSNEDGDDDTFDGGECVYAATDVLLWMPTVHRHFLRLPQRVKDMLF